MDHLSDALATIRLRSAHLGHLDLSAPWGMDCLETAVSSVCYYAAKGGFWLSMDDADTWVGEGQFVLLPSWPRHTLRSGPDAPIAPITAILDDAGAASWDPGRAPRSPSRFAYGGGGAQTELVTFLFIGGGAERGPLLESLPAVIQLSASDGGLDAWFTALQRFIAEEGQGERSGYAEAVLRLADLVFVQLIRAYLSHSAQGAGGWLAAVMDPRLSHPMRAMHAEPGRRWTVADLAREAGLSRSAFALRFRDVVGVTPLDYLIRLRVRIGGDRLRAGERVGAVARQLGYGRPEQFVAHFQRLHGQTPGRFRTQQRKGGAP